VPYNNATHWLPIPSIYNWEKINSYQMWINHKRMY
jgi:hypothetical protein